MGIKVAPGEVLGKTDDQTQIWRSWILVIGGALSSRKKEPERRFRCAVAGSFLSLAKG